MLNEASTAGKERIISVSVATVWTSPDSPREKDRNALLNPVDIHGWFARMDDGDRLDLCTGNRIQTQALYGTRVILLEERGNWAKIAIPDQPTPKNPLGYPGWIPTCQLSPLLPEMEEKRHGIAMVTAHKTKLYSTEKEQGIELSFLTRLPILKPGEDWITVATPHGPRLLRKEDVTVFASEGEKGEGQPTGIEIGEALVKTAKRFLGLRYLWGGLSAYGYDCSGFVYSVYKAHGIIIPRDSSVQSEHGRKIGRDELLPGDLLFFAHEEGKGRVHHVGMYIGDNRMIHSPDTSSCVEIVSLAGYKLEKEHAISRRYV